MCASVCLCLVTRIIQASPVSVLIMLFFFHFPIIFV